MRTRKQRKFILNWDGSDCLALIKEKPTEQDMLEQVYAPLEGSAVDTVFYMQGVGNFAEYRSGILPPIGDAFPGG